MVAAIRILTQIAPVQQGADLAAQSLARDAGLTGQAQQGHAAAVAFQQLPDQQAHHRALLVAAVQAQPFLGDDIEKIEHTADILNSPGTENRRRLIVLRPVLFCRHAPYRQCGLDPAAAMSNKCSESSKAKARMKTEQAEAIALMALAYLAGNEDLLHRFLGETGMNAGDLRAAAGDPAALGGILDFILGDDSRVLDFAESAGLRPEDPIRARHNLPGHRAGDRGAL